MKKNLFATICLICMAGLCLSATESKDLLKKAVKKEELKSLLLMNQSWVPYPDYKDRNGWDALTQELKEELIVNGEAYLDYTWKVVELSDFLEYERSGNRNIMQEPFGDNNNAMMALVMAELAEGKGRFMDQIMNGTWLACEMTTWVLSAHLPAYQTNKRSVPDPNEFTIDLTAGDLGSFYSWVYYFFKDEFDKVSPIIATRLRNNLQERIMDVYMNRSDFWWQAFNLQEGGLVNNWNPWCNSNVLLTFLLLENDPEKLVDGVYRTLISADEFINYTHEDGACEEGPSYWGHAAGKMYDYLDILHLATGGKVSIYDAPIIRNMGEYIARSYVGDGWVVNFADASARGGGEPSVIYRYGRSVDSDLMQQFAAYLFERNGRQHHLPRGRDIFRGLEGIRLAAALEKTKPALPEFESTWYPETEFCYMKNDAGFFFATKGGYNNESHNHNDVGSFSLYYQNIPFFIDIGVGTYTRKTFSSERYDIWTMQSNYHNLPMVNGVAQKNGREYRSAAVVFDPGKKQFSLDISGAYPAGAKVDQWTRSYQLKEAALLIEDDFKLETASEPNILHFLCWSKPEVSEAGKIRLARDGKTLELVYSPRQFTPTVEKIEVEDSRLTRVWGDTVYRLSLQAEKIKKNGKYELEIREVK